MNFTVESLMAAGFTSEQAQKLVTAYTDTIKNNYVPLHRFNEVNTELTTTKESLKQRDNQIKDLKKFEGDNAALQTKITELETSNSTKDTEHQKELTQERKKNMVRLNLLEDANGKPHDVEMVMGLINLEQVNVDATTGKITSGYKEQLDNLKKDKAFLFNVVENNQNQQQNTFNFSNPFNFNQQQQQNQNQQQNQGWKPIGNPPNTGADPNQGANMSSSFGKTLAQMKLNMMGVAPTTPAPTNNNTNPNS